MLIVLRHGQAEPNCADDAGRSLVAAGIAEVERSCVFLHEQGWLPTRVLTSPYKRAQQTAAIVLRELKIEQPMDTELLLQPDADPERTAGLLDALAKSPLLVASHMPLVSTLVRNLSGQVLGFATGSLVVLVPNGQQWRVAAQYNPGQHAYQV